MDIKTQTPEQLKALAYDQLVILEQTKQNIALIQTELNGRQVAPQPVAERAVEECLAAVFETGLAANRHQQSTQHHESTIL